MRRSGEQEKLLDVSQSFPSGFIYRPNFLSREEEAELVSYLGDLPFESSRVRGYEAKRRMMGFGWKYSFKTELLVPGPPLPPFLHVCQRKISKWLDIKEGHIAQALVTEYLPGAGIGWHRDNEKFEIIVGISLSSWCRFKLRPLIDEIKKETPHVRESFSVLIEPRSAYVLQGLARWEYQHSVAPVEGLRHSITFRTLPKTWILPKQTSHRNPTRGLLR